MTASDPGDFRKSPREQREAANERGAPERGEGALPADAEAPEYSRGQPLDDPQPSTRYREDLETEEAKTNDADVRSDERDI